VRNFKDDNNKSQILFLTNKKSNIINNLTVIWKLYICSDL